MPSDPYRAEPAVKTHGHVSLCRLLRAQGCQAAHPSTALQERLGPGPAFQTARGSPRVDGPARVAVPPESSAAGGARHPGGGDQGRKRDGAESAHFGSCSGNNAGQTVATETQPGLREGMAS